MLSILLAIFLIFVNGFFVAAEFALVKVRESQVAMRAAEGSKAAKMAEHIIQNLDPYLSATQLGITLASLGLGWIGEPAVAVQIDALLGWLDVSLDEDSLHLVSFIVAFSLISYLHIVVGEVAPKTLAITKPLGTSLVVSYPMRIFYWVFYPALKVLNASANALLRLVKVEPAAGHGMAVTAEELRHIAQHSTTGGTITAEQGSLLDRVFTFSDRVAREIMVPRGRITAIDVDQDPEQALSFLVESKRHTRYPLYRGDLDEIIGILHLKDLFSPLAQGKDVQDVQQFARPTVYVPETMPAHELLQEFRRLRTHMAIVVDEHGGVSGIITIEDTLEELVGEIQDEFDAEFPPVMEVTGGYSIDGGILLEELTDLLGMDRVESEADTVSGYVMEELGRIAHVGDEVNLGDSSIRVAKMQKMRIDRVMVRIRRKPAKEEAEDEA